MIKFAVIDFKDICIKLLILITITIIAFLIIKNENLNILKICIDDTLNVYSKETINDEILFKNNLINIVKNNILGFNNSVLKAKDINIETDNENEDNNVQEINNSITIKDIDNNSYNIEYGNVKFDIKNNTNYDLDVDNLINKDLEIFKDKSISTILIIHTHGSESYCDTEHTDYYRTEDISKNMIRVGDELENILKNSGYNVIHDKNIYDYPTYSGSYARALESINYYLSRNNNIDIVLDLHRDAIGSKPDFAPTINIDGNEVSKMMIIVGTDQNGVQKHDNWRENLKFALKLQYAGEQMYPGLFRQMSVTNSRYNEHATMGSLLIEVGATGNTLDQSINSMHYLAKILDEVL